MKVYLCVTQTYYGGPDVYPNTTADVRKVTSRLEEAEKWYNETAKEKDPFDGVFVVESEIDGTKTPNIIIGHKTV